MSQTNALPGANAHFINLTTASNMAETYRDEHENILASAYKNAGTLPLSETFNRAAIDAILAQADCEGIRIYYGMDENLKVHAILVGVTEANEDILASQQSRLSESDIIVEIAQRCPDLCPPASPLNS